MNFGERLRELRIELKLTQEGLASKIGQQKASISKYETSRIEPNIEILQKLSDIFEVSIDYLIGKTNKRKLEDEFQTIAAHKDGIEWSEEELNEIEKFKEFVRMKRNQNKQK